MEIIALILILLALTILLQNTGVERKAIGVKFLFLGIISSLCSENLTDEHILYIFIIGFLGNIFLITILNYIFKLKRS